MQMNEMNKNAQYVCEEDEIDLIELFAVIWKRKLFIIVIVFIVSLATVIGTLMMDNIYSSKAVLKPSAQDSSKLSSLMGSFGGIASLAGIDIGGSNDNIYFSMENLLNNQEFISEIVKKYKLEPEIFADDYEKIKSDEGFLKNYKYFVFKAVKEVVSLSQDKKSNFITLGVEHKNPEFAKKLVDILMLELSEKIKANELENINEKIANFKKEIDEASDITLKTKLAEVVSSLVQSKVLSKAQKYYGFTIISEPYVPDMKDKVKPKRSLICVVAFVTSFMFAIFLVFILEFFKNIPEEKKRIFQGKTDEVN